MGLEAAGGGGGGVVGLEAAGGGGGVVGLEAAGGGGGGGGVGPEANEPTSCIKKGHGESKVRYTIWQGASRQTLLSVIA